MHQCEIGKTTFLLVTELIQKLTGVGTLNFKDIAKAFNLKYFVIKNEKEIEKNLKFIFSKSEPYLIEVITNPNQKIIGVEI